MDIATMIAELAVLKAQKAEISRREEQITYEITLEYAPQLRGKTGTQKIDGIKFFIPKQVKWDQAILSGLFARCQANNENPLDYISVSYDVPESRYKAWPESIRTEFEPARTVSTGKTKIQIEEEK